MEVGDVSACEGEEEEEDEGGREGLTLVRATE